MAINPGARNPEMFQHAYLLAKDFDGTVACTFQKSPAGIGVHETYEQAVEELFGLPSLEAYLKNGGLQNQSPSEVVRGIASDADASELEQLTARFVDTKLAISLGQIGTRFPDGSVWPRPTPGYLELCEKIQAAREGGRMIDDLIISAGHEPFIKKTYETWGIDLPTHIVAEDTLRRLIKKGVLGASIEQLNKPSPILMDIALNTWKRGYDIDDTIEVPGERDRIVYAGDDPKRDGKLAETSGVAFVLVKQGAELQAWQSVATWLQLGRLAATGAQHE